jgi:multiple sugar transport system permease protein
MSRKAVVMLVVYLTVAFVLAVEVLPMLWMVATSLKREGQFFTDPPMWLPPQPTLEHYGVLFTQLGFARFIVNSLVVATLTTLFAVGLGALGAYAIARIGTGSRAFIPLLFVQRMAPAAAILIPIFIMISGIGAIDTTWGLALAHLSFSLPAAVWLMIGFFRELPQSVEEAALIDGCSRWQSLWRVVLPLTAPGLAATAILTAIGSWNEFFFAVILTSTPRAQTLPVALSNLVIPIIETRWGPMAAAGVITVLPVFLFALTVQRHLVSGLTGGAVKG